MRDERNRNYEKIPAVAPKWWSKNPDLLEEWRFPKEEELFDFFDNSTQKGNEDCSLIPKCCHHNPSIRPPRRICMKYQHGECQATCRYTQHELQKELQEAVKKIYKKRRRISSNDAINRHIEVRSSLLSLIHKKKPWSVHDSRETSKQSAHDSIDNTSIGES